MKYHLYYSIISDMRCIYFPCFFFANYSNVLFLLQLIFSINWYLELPLICTEIGIKMMGSNLIINALNTQPLNRKILKKNYKNFGHLNQQMKKKIVEHHECVEHSSLAPLRVLLTPLNKQFKMNC